MKEGHYHFHTKFISRGDGRAVCAAAAYRSGERIEDERYGLTFDYTQRSSVYSSEIRTPENAPNWAKHREQLWNGVEAFENRKKARLAREFEVSLPAELSHDQKQEAVRRFVDNELVKRGMVADISYHDFTGSKKHNPHAHILVTTRKIEGDTFSKNKTREWDSKDTLVEWREAWARHVNHVLEESKIDTRIDHRSYKERGIDKIPLHESRQAHYRRHKEIEENKKQLQEVNNQISNLEKQLVQRQQQQQRIDAVIQFGNELARKKAARKEQQQQEESNPQLTQKPSSAPSDKEVIEQWQIYQDIYQERSKPRSDSHTSDHIEQPERGGTYEQKIAKLREDMITFDADDPKPPEPPRKRGRRR